MRLDIQDNSRQGSYLFINRLVDHFVGGRILRAWYMGEGHMGKLSLEVFYFQK